MKLTHSIIAKTAAIILLVIFLASAVFSCIGAVFFAEEGFYTDRDAGNFFTSSWCRDTASRIVYENVYWQWIANRDSNIETEPLSLAPIGNLSYEIYLVKPDGAILIASAVAGDTEFGYVDEFTFCGEIGYENSYFSVKTSIAKELTEHDALYYAAKIYDLFYSVRFSIFGIAAGSILISVILFVFLMCAAGKKKGRAEPVLSWLDKIPLDLLVLLYVMIIFISYAFLHDTLFYSNDLLQAIGIILFLLEAFLLLLSFCMSFAVRIKCRTLWKNTLVYIVLHALFSVMSKIFTNLNIVWKVALVFAAVCLVELFAILTDHIPFMLTVWLVGNFVVFVALCLSSIGFHTVQKSAEKLSRGDLSHKTDTSFLFGDIKRHAENLNSIGDGMARAVEEKMKSERFKTELITNVSHDIKTPLTSIVNYVDLLKKENIENEAATEYIGVLERQASRLKKLTEDLVEASKASTGNINVERERTNLCELLSQSVAEYGEKFAALPIEPIITLPDREVAIFADGRLIWRVFDNLLANICKYSQSGTRAYFDLQTADGKVKAVFKNISRYSLNITADALLERFVRGDSSRSTEGSGLGLSIANSLTELQGGVLELSVDGDLFKVTLTFDEMQ